MKETYRLDFKVSNKRGSVAVMLPEPEGLPSTSDRDMLVRSLRTIGDVAHALLMIMIVGAQPFWVMWFLTALVTNR
jgi:hypothetical protein